ncbi:hypothetical protein LK459_09980 [Gordonia otitidis]|uniref:hypothetical protein n=1 Tax=Gordonia otitidis TaxID=249058 RepID=UPI001D148BC2|nr:hypothetical protein [Gordonia otitidis]UEA61106.1 hypothetical protein LK459_09980 [Gordonia otitidis]
MTTDSLFATIDPMAVLADCASAETRRSYTAKWTVFAQWCAAEGVNSLPATTQTVTRFLWHLAGVGGIDAIPTRSRSSVNVYYSAIVYVHRNVEAVATDSATAGVAKPLWDDTAMRGALTELRALYPTEPQPKRPHRPLRRIFLTQMITVARGSATTWQDRLEERRDSALLLLPSMTGLGGREVVQLRVGDVYRRSDHWWVRVKDLRHNTQLEPLSVCDSDEFVLCAPCAWIRWLEVLDVHADLGRAGVIKLLARPDRHRYHVCKKRATHLKLQRNWQAFPPGRRARFGPGHVTDDVVTGIVRRRLTAAYPNISHRGYRSRSLTDGYLLEEVEAGSDIRTVATQLGLASISVDHLNRLTNSHLEDSHVHPH